MGEILLLLIVNALIINGFWFATGKGQALEWLGRFIEWSTPQWICKPVSQCRQCMSSVWGSAGFLSFGHSYLGLPLWMWPAYCLALCGMITFFSSIHE